MGQSANNRAALPALLQAVARPGPIVILPHDNPDPDSLASAATLVYLFRELARREASIALGGIVGRAENDEDRQHEQNFHQREAGATATTSAMRMIEHGKLSFFEPDPRPPAGG